MNNDNEEKIIYREVYSILKLLGSQYIDKIPKSLYDMIRSNITNTRDLEYKSLKEINKNNIQKKSLAIVALIHISYWCESEKEKEELNQIFMDNFIKNEDEKREKYNPNNIFIKDSKMQVEKEVEDMIVYKEPLWKKIFNKIKGLFCFKR